MSRQSSKSPNPYPSSLFRRDFSICDCYYKVDPAAVQLIECNKSTCPRKGYVLTDSESSSEPLKGGRRRTFGSLSVEEKGKEKEKEGSGKEDEKENEDPLNVMDYLLDEDLEAATAEVERAQKLRGQRRSSGSATESGTDGEEESACE